MPKVFTCAYCKKHLIGCTYTIVNHVLKNCAIFDEKKHAVVFNPANVEKKSIPPSEQNTYIQPIAYTQDEPISK